VPRLEEDGQRALAAPGLVDVAHGRVEDAQHGHDACR
jgi:hypothetical protein